LPAGVRRLKDLRTCPIETLESPMLKKILGALACTGALMVALAGPASAGATTMVTWYPKHVKSTVSEVRVFAEPHSYVVWGTWGPCHNFYTDRNDGGRYHTHFLFNNIWYDAWVTADPAYVAPGHC
jgi:hypothetical protein